MATSWKSQLGGGKYCLQFETDDYEKYKVVEKAAQQVVDANSAIPTPDPAASLKSEVEKWYHEYHAIKDELKQEKMYHSETEKLADRYCAELQTAKREVAREIFEEIEKNMVIFGDVALSTYFRGIGWKVFAELKKKYTEDQT